MGCVSSNLLNNDDDFPQLSTSSLSHHIVSLTSTTYGLLNLDPPPPPPPSATTPPTPPPRFHLGSIFPTPLLDPKPLWSDPETINSWELMSGLDNNDSTRFSPITKSDRCFKENADLTPPVVLTTGSFGGGERPLERFEKLCPPNGEGKVVIYTTTLRGIRKTFEDCNVVRAAVEGFGVSICERDVSMDMGFREELRDLMKGKEMVPPRVFVKGRYVGGAEEVMKMVEEGLMGELLDGLPKKRGGEVCEGCGDVRFLPCFSCNGSSKLVMVVKKEVGEKPGRRTLVVRCPECNENGLVLCPICS